MSVLNICRCPACGATVVVPNDATANNNTHKNIDQLAEATCGCWAMRMTDENVSRLLDAIMFGDKPHLGDSGIYQ